MANKKENAESFEALLKRLEDIVQKMESGGLALEESMTLYEDGIKMADQLSAMLAGSREKVMKMVNAQEGKPSLEPFESNEEAGE